MKHVLKVCFVAITLNAGLRLAGAQSPATSDKVSFAGTWAGRMNDLPAISLKIEEAQKNISGHIVFFLQERPDPSRPWHVVGESTSWLLAVHMEGRLLTFEVGHFRCHECAELGPNVKFRMELAGSNEAWLWNLSQASHSNPVKLVRQTEPGPVPPR
jgi:hypothetical protein